MEFVVNEWLPEYFKPDASHEEKKKLEIFLNKFMAKNDKIFVRRPSNFLSKIYRISKLYQDNYKVYSEIKMFHSIILLNPEKCSYINDNEFSLPNTIEKKLTEGGNTISDKYLFEAAAVTGTRTIVTTDAKLKTLMEEEKLFRLILLDDFLEKY
jgi:hypothetical protein